MDDGVQVDPALQAGLRSALMRRVPWDTVARTLGMSTQEGAHYLESLGAEPGADDAAGAATGAASLTFAEFFAAVWLSPPAASAEYGWAPKEQAWRPTAAAVEQFLVAYCADGVVSRDVVRDGEPMLMIGSLGAAVLGDDEALDYPDDDHGTGRACLGQVTAVGPLLPMVREMLRELARDDGGRP
jgi:hypothetical protein